MDYQTFFKCWKNWEDFEKLEVFETHNDGINGVYAFRMKNKFGRLKGESCVLYIGKADQDPERNKRAGIWHRLMNYKQNNRGASERLKDIADKFEGESSIEYAYEICDTPRDTEKTLLESYYKEHLEFPPLNRSAWVSKYQISDNMYISRCGRL